MSAENPADNSAELPAMGLPGQMQLILWYLCSLWGTLETEVAPADFPAIMR
jgi:hypothetical protein